MADVKWLIRRLKAMSLPEIFWRLSQKKIQKKEGKRFRGTAITVCDSLFDNKYRSLAIDPGRMYLNLNNKTFGLERAIHLLGSYDYDKYKKSWNAGFHKDNEWPDTFSYDLEYKQRDDIGDARTNWELNRHFQFALLAKDYYASGNKKYLDELTELFNDWNEKNPFLHGISWTSVMEVAIRVSNWCYAYCFLSGCESVPETLLKKLEVGIINMTDYISQHYSRYSSANNHLIVEAFAIGQSGILLDYHPWIDLSVELLTREFPLQNYSDGVNKELSLHYESFYMEAVGLLLRLLTKNGCRVPESWYEWLPKMSKYVADCMGQYGETVVFGDDDEGKVLDLSGTHFGHYRYVLGLMSFLLEKKYTSLSDCTENLHWLFTEKEFSDCDKKPSYVPNGNVCYKEGGNTILRSKDNKVLIGIDHAALGFGSIAAHGHADALSFQLFYEGNPVFIDPGTYIYHCDINSRNEFRKTCNHNTVCVDGKDQSEMLGAFLWGRKAKAELLNFEENDGAVKIVMQHDGYKPVIHKRTIEFDGDRHLTIEDVLENISDKAGTGTIILSDALFPEAGKDCIKISSGEKLLCHINISSESEIINNCRYSAAYGISVGTDSIKYKVTDMTKTDIYIEP